MLQIDNRSTPPSFALFELGFRPFFAAASLFAVIAIGTWVAMYASWSSPVTLALGPTLWHAHEMVFGYAMAVVAGFLLTAVGNWTGVPGLRGLPLLLLLLAWATARGAFFLPPSPGLAVAALADGIFSLGLVYFVARPIVQVRQWKQLGLVSKVILIASSNAVFYAGAFGYLEGVAMPSLYAGLYLLLALLFTMARRVLPFFIERGVVADFIPRNRRWIDIGSLVLFLAWGVTDIFLDLPGLLAWLSLLLFMLHAMRLYDWFTPAIFRVPLLWSLYLGYGFLVFGFALKALSIWAGVPPTLALHAFTVGGIGLTTMGMMARVSLGHTGRNVFEPPRVLNPVFGLLAAGAFVRVVVPLGLPGQYLAWVVVSSLLWMLAFAWLLWIYLPMLARPRLDGRPG